MLPERTSTNCRAYITRTGKFRCMDFFFPYFLSPSDRMSVSATAAQLPTLDSIPVDIGHGR